MLIPYVPQIGFITMDNASNCNTMMAELEQLLRERGYRVHRHGNRIRYVVYLSLEYIF